MRWIALLLVGLVAACDVVVEPPRPVPAALPSNATPAQISARNFAQVVRTVEPVAERECRSRTRGVNCNFRIEVDNRVDQPPNAFQTLDQNEQPVIVFNVALIASARNEDELAFVLGHEAAHHVAGHIARQRENAAAGAILFGGLTALGGGDAAAVREASEVGAMVGVRTYSKEFELEADVLGTIITARAGYDPVRGAEFFRRIPDPGNRFLGTHPPNAERIRVVRQTAASL